MIWRRVSHAIVVGDLLAVWVFEDPKHPRYLIDGLEGPERPWARSRRKWAR